MDVLTTLDQTIQSLQQARARLATELAVANGSHASHPDTDAHHQTMKKMRTSDAPVISAHEPLPNLIIPPPSSTHTAPLHSPSLHAPNALDRLRSTAKATTTVTSPKQHDHSDTQLQSPTPNHNITTTNGQEPVQDRLARFHLVAYSGDTREVIAPPSTNFITLPPLAKSFVALVWQERPKAALVLRKPGDRECTQVFVEACEWLRHEGIKVVVETESRPELANFADGELLDTSHSQVHKTNVDFIVALGGDGTFIRAAHAFPNGCPPLLAFALGTLGFLTPFPAHSLCEALAAVVQGGFKVRLRTRLEFEVHRAHQPDSVQQDVVCVLNEAVIDRGASSNVTKLILYSNQGDDPVTTALGDGIIVATPTGSTAYSLSAGGSMVHPSVPAILVTPICPHSLSFRPILIPDSATLRIEVAHDARNSAWISFDGRPGVELKPGDWVSCKYSPFPVPAIMPFRAHDSGQTFPGAAADEWLLSLRTALHWNSGATTTKNAAL